MTIKLTNPTVTFGAGAVHLHLGKREVVLSTLPGHTGGDVFAYLHGRGDQHRAEAGGIIDQQLRPRVPPEDRVLHPAARRGHIEPLAVPAEPVRAQMRAPIAADPSDNGVTPLSQERPDLVGRCHIPSRYRAAVAWWGPTRSAA